MTIMGGTRQMKRLLKTALAATALLTIGAVSVAQAEDTLVWWDFLGGGDGVRMKSMIDEFKKEHDSTLKNEATTHNWGTPFYTKFQTSAAVGQGPDIMTYHESRIPLCISTGSLSEITPYEMKASCIQS